MLISSFIDFPPPLHLYTLLFTSIAPIHSYFNKHRTFCPRIGINRRIKHAMLLQCGRRSSSRAIGADVPSFRCLVLGRPPRGVARTVPTPPPLLSDVGSSRTLPTRHSGTCITGTCIQVTQPICGRIRINASTERSLFFHRVRSGGSPRWCIRRTDTVAPSALFT
jgi:hypothetical protein